MSKELRVVLVDDDEKRSPAFRDVWRTILQSVFPSVDVRVIGDVDAVTDIMNGRPHVLVIDNVFPDKVTGRDIPNRGVDFVVEQKSNFPDCLFILYTGNTFQVDVLGNKFPNPDIIVTKTALKNNSYQRYIADRVGQQLSRLPIPDLAFPEPKDAIEIEAFRSDLHSIVEQCLLVVQDRVGSDFVKQVNLERLGGGFSGSYVYLAKIFGSDRYHNLPLVLKITEGTDTSNEVARYNTFARLQMPHDMRVDLLGWGRTGNYSGALYAFAFGKIGGISSATDEIRKGKFEFIELVTNKLFLSDEIGWYKNVKADIGADEFYSNSEEYSPAKDGRRLDGLRTNVDEVFGVGKGSIDEDHYAIESFRCEHVRRYLRKFYDKKIPRTISHGDFNTNNIILSATAQAISTIDFEYTGHDCFYKDFISLECSVRTAWNAHSFTSAADCWQLVEAERMLLDGSAVDDATRVVAVARPYFEAVSKIRSAAMSSIGKAGHSFDADLYALSLAFHMMKLNGMRIWDHSAKIKLIACLLGCCEKLQRL